MAKRPKAVCQKVSKKYLSLYIAEFQFRYNNRMKADFFGVVISLTESESRGVACVGISYLARFTSA
jgi:hypothetical protein